MNKNRFFVFGFIALIFALVLAGCKENPKALAKQTYDLTQGVLSNPLKAVSSLVKVNDIKKKVSKLSAADKQIYNEDLARLIGQGGGELGILGNLLDGEAAETLNTILGAIGILNSSAPTAPAGETAASGGKTAESGKTADSKSSSGGGGDMKWTVVDNPFRSPWNIVAIVYINDEFAAWGTAGAKSISPDGITWTGLEQYDSAKIQWAAAYGKNKYVLARWGLNYSSDGEKWKEVLPDDFRGVAYGNNRFVAGGVGGKIAYSTDGEKWTVAKDSPLGFSTINAIAFGNGKFVAGNAKGKMATSTDGVNWTEIDVYNIFGSENIYSIAYGNGKFVAGGVEGKMATSTDSVNWTEIDTGTLFDYTDKNGLQKGDIRGIAWAKDKFVAGGGDKIAYSTGK
jgi:hypothetical protein